jgi:hypothetical protein
MDIICEIFSFSRGKRVYFVKSSGRMFIIKRNVCNAAGDVFRRLLSSLSTNNMAEPTRPGTGSPGYGAYLPHAPSHPYVGHQWFSLPSIVQYFLNSTRIIIMIIIIIIIIIILIIIHINRPLFIFDLLSQCDKKKLCSFKGKFFLTKISLNEFILLFQS